MTATNMVHWPGKSTAACEEHTVKLKNLAGFMGFPVSVTPVDGVECENCINEAKRK